MALPRCAATRSRPSSLRNNPAPGARSRLRRVCRPAPPLRGTGSCHCNNRAYGRDAPRAPTGLWRKPSIRQRCCQRRVRRASWTCRFARSQARRSRPARAGRAGCARNRGSCSCPESSSAGAAPGRPGRADRSRRGHRNNGSPGYGCRPGIGSSGITTHQTDAKCIIGGDDTKFKSTRP